MRIGEKYKVKRVNTTVGRVYEGYSDSVACTTKLSWKEIESHLLIRDNKLPLKGFWS